MAGLYQSGLSRVLQGRSRGVLYACAPKASPDEQLEPHSERGVSFDTSAFWENDQCFHVPTLPNPTHPVLEPNLHYSERESVRQVRSSYVVFLRWMRDFYLLDLQKVQIQPILASTATLNPTQLVPDPNSQYFQGSYFSMF